MINDQDYKKYWETISVAMADDVYKDDASARIVYNKPNGELAVTSYRLLTGNLNLWNGLVAIWGAYSVATPAASAIERGVSLVLFLADMYELSSSDLDQSHAAVLYCIKLLGGMTDYVSVDEIVETMQQPEWRRVCKHTSLDSVKSSIEILKQMYVLRNDGNDKTKVMICERIMPSTFRGIQKKIDSDKST